jgi:hypothetical protein
MSIAIKRELVICIDRPASHPKGEKHLTIIPVGGAVPAGVIIGKGAVLTLKQRNIWADGVVVLSEPSVILD